MNEKEFIELSKQAVVDDLIENGVAATIEDIFVVWSCKTLQNNKALLSHFLTTGNYYEVTFNGNKNELYFDAYKKEINKCIKL